MDGPTPAPAERVRWRARYRCSSRPTYINGNGNGAFGLDYAGGAFFFSEALPTAGLGTLIVFRPTRLKIWLGGCWIIGATMVAILAASSEIQVPTPVALSDFFCHQIEMSAQLDSRGMGEEGPRELGPSELFLHDHGGSRENPRLGSAKAKRGQLKEASFRFREVDV